MNTDTLKGQWKQIKGRIQEQWGELTDDDLDVAEGHRDYLIGKLQERYGMARDAAAEKVREFERAL